MDEPNIKPRVDYMINIHIPEACLDPDGNGDCPCHVEPPKQEKNPV